MLRFVVASLFLVTAGLAGAQTFEIEGEDGTICAAFAFDRGLIATAAHCTIQGGNYSILGGGTAMLLSRGVFESEFLTENELTAQDVALLTTFNTLPKPPRRTKRDAKVGEILEVEPPGFGYRTCRVVAQMGDAYDLACEMKAGWSGAPVYARRRFGGRVLIGLISGRIGSVGDGMAVMVHARALMALPR